MVERLFKLKLAIEQIVVDPNWTILRVFSIPFNFTCSLLFFIFNLLKLSTSMGFFPNLKYQNTKKHLILLFIHEEQTKSCIPKNRKEKLQKKIKVN